MAQLFVWGSGGAGQLGLGDTLDYALPQHAIAISDDKHQIVLNSVTCGGCHSAGVYCPVGNSAMLCLSATGELFVWGDNERQQLGPDATHQRVATTPTHGQLADQQRYVRLVACGWSHTLAVCSAHTSSDAPATDDDDVVYAWGDNAHKQLGRSVASNERMAILRFVNAGRLRVASVACGWKHSLLSTATGDAFAWGSGRSGELGLGDAVLVADRPTRVHIATDGDSEVSDSSPTLPSIQKVLCGWQHSLFLAVDGTVRTCGSNRHGQLGRPAATHRVNGTPECVVLATRSRLRVSQVAVGWHFALCVSTERSGKELLAWGKNSHGQLGLGSYEAATAPTPVLLDTPSGIRAIACGSEHALVVTHTGALLSCGWGEHGNLGHGDCATRNRLTRVAFFSDAQLNVHAVAAGGAVSLAIATPQ